MLWTLHCKTCCLFNLASNKTPSRSIRSRFPETKFISYPRLFLLVHCSRTRDDDKKIFYALDLGARTLERFFRHDTSTWDQRRISRQARIAYNGRCYVTFSFTAIRRVIVISGFKIFFCIRTKSSERDRTQEW